MPPPLYPGEALQVAAEAEQVLSSQPGELAAAAAAVCWLGRHVLLLSGLAEPLPGQGPAAAAAAHAAAAAQALAAAAAAAVCC